jgi:putative N6-adenine-specific DNA methylase
MTRANVTSAGFSGLIGVKQAEAQTREPLLSGYIVTNPPYGERLGTQEDSLASIRALRTLALASRGSLVVALNANEAFEKTMSLRPSKKNRMNNGSIKCSLYQYKIAE